MSTVSLNLFYDALNAWQPGADPEPLRHAAREHIGASRSMDVMMAEYAAALEFGNHDAAQQVAEELAPVRQAAAVLAGALPGLEAVLVAWTESGLFFASWRDLFKEATLLSLTDTNNNISLSNISETPDYFSSTDPSTWTNANEVTGGANWPTGGINLSTGTYAPTITKTGPGPTVLSWSMQPIAILATTTTAAAYGAYIYAAGLTPKAKITGVWFGGTGYSTVTGTFAITWNALGIMTMQMAA